MQEKLLFKRELKNLIITIFATVLSSLGLWVFVYPSNFAPSGIDGVATMLQTLTGLNAGVYSLALNLPLLVVAWFFLKKRYVIYTIIFTVLTSALLVVYEAVDMYQYVTATDKLISAIFSGIMLGVRTGLMLKIGASSGGIDIVACIVQRKKPYGHIERFISIICYIIIGLSVFVYKDMECIFLSIVQMVVFEKLSSVVLSETRNAIEIKIITKEPDEIKAVVLHELKHGATILESKGGYTEEGSTMLVSVINNRQIPEFLTIVKRYPNTFVYFSDVKGVQGNFRWFKDDEVK